MELQYWAEALLYLVIICISIAFLRKKHSGEIFLIWYLFSFFFTLTFGMFALASYNGVTPVELCGSYADVCGAVFTLFSNIQDELAFVGTIAALSVIPQVLSYILSGLSGSARAPTLLWQIEKFAIWSFIKFSACYAGILVSFFIWGPQFVGRSHQIGAALLQIAIPFGLAAVELWLTETMPSIGRRHEHSLQPLKTLHGFFTRNALAQQTLDDAHQTRQDSSIPKI